MVRYYHCVKIAQLIILMHRKTGINGQDLSDDDCLNPADKIRPYEFRSDQIANKVTTTVTPPKSSNSAFEVNELLHGERGKRTLDCIGKQCSDSRDCMDHGCRDCLQNDSHKEKKVCRGELAGSIVFEPRACAMGIMICYVA